MSWRDTKNVARRVVHDTMRIPAIYISTGTSPVETPVLVRVLERWDAQGDLQGFDFATAERKATTPQIIALVEELTPRRLGVFSVALGEAYKVENTDPVDGITITASCHRITDQAVLAGLPLPEDA